MNPSPLISVIMSVYNGERYLEISLDSVLNQTYTNFEFIIHDDGSTDNTTKLIESRKDARIKFSRSNINQGLFSCLKSLTPKAQGKYIRLWSYDDIMKPHCLASEIDFYERNPGIGLCISEKENIDERGEIIPSQKPQGQPAITPTELAAQIMFYYGNLSPNISTLTIKKEILEEVGGFSNLYISADFDLCERISEKYPIGYIEEPLMFLRRHSKQFSRWVQVGPVNMKENLPIFERLLKRMPQELNSYAKLYLRKTQYVKYFHYMISNLFRGNLNTAGQIFSQLREKDNLLAIFSWWLCTFGGKIFVPKPKFKQPTSS